MRKTAKWVAILLIFPLLLGVCACGKAEGEEVEPIRLVNSKYPYEPDVEIPAFTKKQLQNGHVFYFADGIGQSDLERSVRSVALAEEHCGAPKNIFLLEDGVTRVEENRLYLASGDPVELVLSVLLESKAENQLPFGIFAGVSASLLKEDADEKLFSGNTLAKNLRKFPYVTDLQYPLYTSFLTERAERRTAWSYAVRLGDAFLKEHDLSDLQTAKKEDLAPSLMAVGASVPSFFCPVGDSFYPLKVETETLRYYFSPSFEDERLSKEVFSLAYPNVKAYVEENEQLLSKEQALFEPFAPKAEPERGPDGEELPLPSSPPRKIDVFLGDFGLNDRLCNIDYSREAACLKSVSVSVYMLTEFVLYRTAGLGRFHYGLCDYFNTASSYCRAALYDLYLGKGETSYPKEVLSSAKKNYERAYGRANEVTFDAYDYTDCLSQALNEENKTFVYTVQLCSFLKYTYETYGVEALLEPEKNEDGKSMDELIENWQEALEKKYES